MADIKLEDLVPDVVVEIQGAPSFTIIHSLRRATSELCERTLFGSTRKIPWIYMLVK